MSNQQQAERIKASNQQLIDLDEKQGIVRAYINKFNVIDAAGDLSLPGSFKKTFSERLKKIWWLKNHDWDMSLGVTIALEEDSFGAIATGKFNLKKQIGLDTFNDYILFQSEGRTLQHSVRVSPIKYQIDKDIFVVQEWKMTEWSTLTRPGAIEDTPMLSIKSMEDEIEKTKKALELKYSDERLKAFEDKIARLESLLDEAVKSTSSIQTNESSAKELITFIDNLKIG